jgi:hypothetical protein
VRGYLDIRGFGPVKEAAVEQMRAAEDAPAPQEDRKAA